MSITYEEVEVNELIDSDVLEYIPKECECGGDIEFTETLRQIYCTNEFCFYKVASRLEFMAKEMKVDGWGESTCIEVCKHYGLKSPFQVYLIKESMERGNYPEGVAAFDTKISEIYKDEVRRVRLWELVKYAGIEGINTSAYKLFSGYDSLEDFYNDLEKYQIAFIGERLGLVNIESSVLAVRIYNNLLKHKGELFFGERHFDIIKETGRSISIAITGGVDGFKNKGEFIKFLNSRYEGVANFVMAGGVTNSLDILVADNDTSSSKFRKADNINSKSIAKAVDKHRVGEFEVGEIVPYGYQILVTDSKKLIGRLDDVLKG